MMLQINTKYTLLLCCKGTNLSGLERFRYDGQIYWLVAQSYSNRLDTQRSQVQYLVS